jgi:hypothetical protein
MHAKAADSNASWRRESSDWMPCFCAFTNNQGRCAIYLKFLIFAFTRSFLFYVYISRLCITASCRLWLLHCLCTVWWKASQGVKIIRACIENWCQHNDFMLSSYRSRKDGTKERFVEWHEALRDEERTCKLMEGSLEWTMEDLFWMPHEAIHETDPFKGKAHPMTSYGYSLLTSMICTRPWSLA